MYLLFLYFVSFSMYILLRPFQIVGRFGKSKYIDFAMHLDKHYVLHLYICQNHQKFGTEGVLIGPLYVYFLILSNNQVDICSTAIHKNNEIL